MPCHLLLLVVIHLPASHTHTRTFTRTVTHNKTHTQYIYIHTHSHHTRTRTTARVPTVTEEVLSGPRNTLVAAPRYSHPNPRQAEAPVALTCTVTAAAGPTRPGGLTRAWSPATTLTGPRPPPASALPRVGRTQAGDSALQSPRLPPQRAHAHARLGQEGSAPASLPVLASQLPAGSLKTGTRPGRLQEAGSALPGPKTLRECVPKGKPPHTHKSRSSCESLLWPYCFDHALVSEEGNRSWEEPRLTPPFLG